MEQFIITTGIIGFAAAGGLIAIEGAWKAIAIKAAISGSLQYGIKGEIDVVDLVSDATIRNPLGSSIINNLTVDINVSEDEVTSSFPIYDKPLLNTIGDFSNTFIWGAFGNKSMDAIVPQLKNNTEKLMFETVITLPTSTAEEGISKAVENNQKK